MFGNTGFGGEQAAIQSAHKQCLLTTGAMVFASSLPEFQHDLHFACCPFAGFGASSAPAFGAAPASPFGASAPAFGQQQVRVMRNLAVKSSRRIPCCVTCAMCVAVQEACGQPVAAHL